MYVRGRCPDYIAAWRSGYPRYNRPLRIESLSSSLWHPKLRITQCFNCFKNGHRAANCKNTPSAGNVTKNTIERSAKVRVPMESGAVSVLHGLWKVIGLSRGGVLHTSQRIIILLFYFSLMHSFRDHM